MKLEKIDEKIWYFLKKLPQHIYIIDTYALNKIYDNMSYLYPALNMPKNILLTIFIQVINQFIFYMPIYVCLSYNEHMNILTHKVNYIIDILC